MNFWGIFNSDIGLQDPMYSLLDKIEFAIICIAIFVVVILTVRMINRRKKMIRKFLCCIGLHDWEKIPNLFCHGMPPIAPMKVCKVCGWPFKYPKGENDKQ